MPIRLPSINAGLAASTVTPGSTPPVESVTDPEIAPTDCADAVTGTSASIARAIRPTLARENVVFRAFPTFIQILLETTISYVTTALGPA